MPLSEVTVDKALVRLGHYRVTMAQIAAAEGPPDDISGALLLALGLRESLLQNINNKWQTDKGCFQITERFHEEFLKSQPGCPEGSFTAVAGHTAYEDGYCPRYTPALVYALDMLKNNRNYALSIGVTGEAAVRFAVAAYNAGIGGAVMGQSAGNVDMKTTGEDYSAWVIEHRRMIIRWLNDHPKWKI